MADIYTIEIIHPDTPNKHMCIKHNGEFYLRLPYTGGGMKDVNYSLPHWEDNVRKARKEVQKAQEKLDTRIAILQALRDYKEKNNG